MIHSLFILNKQDQVIYSQFFCNSLLFDSNIKSRQLEENDLFMRSLIKNSSKFRTQKFQGKKAINVKDVHLVFQTIGADLCIFLNGTDEMDEIICKFQVCICNLCYYSR